MSKNLPGVSDDMMWADDFHPIAPMARIASATCGARAITGLLIEDFYLREQEKPSLKGNVAHGLLQALEICLDVADEHVQAFEGKSLQHLAKYGFLTVEEARGDA